VLGVILQSPWIFIVLSAMLGWSALVPTHNPFNAFFNRVIADGRRFETLPPAPEPRRFAEGMAATLAMAIAVALLAGASPAAWLLEGLFALAVMEVIFARFCTGAYVYHLLCSRVSTRPCPPSPRTRDDIDGWA
jgi:hypothetical protein